MGCVVVAIVAVVEGISVVSVIVGARVPAAIISSISCPLVFALLFTSYRLMLSCATPSGITITPPDSNTALPTLVFARST